MREILVVANRTIFGANLLDAIRRRAADGDATFRLVVPQSKPSDGYVIYDEVVRDSAQVRVDLALSAVGAEGIVATGEVGDEDPFLATMDAVAERRPSEIIISTHPATHSGWLRRDLIERIQNATGLPVEHVVVDLANEVKSYVMTLVIANRTSSGEELIEHLKAKAADGREHLFVAVVPQTDGGGHAPREARERLAAMLDRLRATGLLSSGMIGDPNPYTATINALELFNVDDVVISTLPDERSGWMRAHLIERVSGATSAPVEHIVVDTQATTTTAPAV
jgi:hypothetical protein